NLTCADERAIHDLLLNLADLLDLDLRGGLFWVWLHNKKVRVCLHVDLFTRTAGPAGVQVMPVGCRLAVQGLGQPQCGEAFSNGTFTVEEIGMGQAPMGDGCPESGNRMVVTDD